MKKEELIKHCRYYKGEEECPYKTDEGRTNKGLLWFYEKKWVCDYEERESYYIEYVQDYICHELGLFEETDGVPISLKALLFNRYDHWTQGDPEGFKEWYKREYRRD